MLEESEDSTFVPLISGFYDSEVTFATFSELVVLVLLSVLADSDKISVVLLDSLA